MRPIPLGPNLVRQFYRGGNAIRGLRGLDAGDDHTPEDWIASVTTRAGTDTVGLTRLPDGRWLGDAVAADPEAFLGTDHTDHWGADPALLVKLLATDQRLVVHCHPDRAFARRHLGCAHGKTEAWVVLATGAGDALVYVGFSHDVDMPTLRRWVLEQDTPALLSALQPVPVAPGDALLVPAGVPHAIGAGIMVTEVQEPTDLSVLLEWRGFDVDGRRLGHLGLGFDLALTSVDRSAWTPDRLAGLRRPGTEVRLGPVVDRDGTPAVPPVQDALPASASPFFGAEWLHPAPSLVRDASYAVLVVTSGTGRLRTAEGHETALRRGDTVLVPHGAGACELSGPVEVLRCLPPGLP
ncbi:MAG: class I mannose-6-phosphate isomerase [Acidimicrobiales bacterium]